MPNRFALSILTGFSAFASLCATPAIAASHPVSIQDILSFRRVGDPVLSPQEDAVVFSVTRVDIAANRNKSDLWLKSMRGNPEPVQLTSNDAADFSPQWSADGKHIYFLSTRSGSVQLWRIAKAGGEAQMVSNYPLDVGAFKLSPDNSKILVSFEVSEKCKTLACEVEVNERATTSKASGTLHNRYFIRHWDTWKTGRIARLFVDAVQDGQTKNQPRLMSTIDADVPTKPFGGSEEWAFTPDGNTAFFVGRVKGAQEPTSTNLDVWQVDLKTGGLANLSADNLATDTSPTVSPDGRYLAYLSMSRPGYESDRLVAKVRNLKTGVVTSVSDKLDRSLGGLTFGPDSNTLFATANDLGQNTLWRGSVKGKSWKRVTGAGHVGGFSVGRSSVVFAHDDLQTPAELFVTGISGGKARALTHLNESLLQDIKMGEPEQFKFEGAGGDTVYGYVVKPADYVEGKKYPVAFLVHGGPQGSFDNHFHYRWNAQAFAGQGFAVIMIDFHGSTGYGQAFTDAIRGDWGGKPLVDLQRGLAAAAQTYPFLDTTRACALGGSYGGYMMNWIAGTWSEGFRCIVNHAGIFDNRSMAYSTEELWFDEWEHGGTYYDHPENYEKHNPVLHVKAWKTPILVTHGAMDFRVPLEQGIASFTAAQHRGVPSEFLVFPDENHWILKPQNSIQWHDSVFRWLKRWTAK